jgi:hypothetical protein
MVGVGQRQQSSLLPPLSRVSRTILLLPGQISGTVFIIKIKELGAYFAVVPASREKNTPLGCGIVCTPKEIARIDSAKKRLHR